MMKNQKISQYLKILFGFLAVTLSVFNFIVLFRLKPKMIQFETISKFEDGLLTAVGFSLLAVLLFYLLMLWQFINYIRQAEQLKPLPLILIISGVLSMLFIFSDIALLSDIHRQYRNNFSQPEWLMVFPIMGVQFIITIIFLFIIITNRYTHKNNAFPVRDSNVFLILHYVGVISGLMGLGLASLGFFYPSGWNLTTHGILGGLVLLFPYGLAFLYWLITKYQEKDRQWFDEKQTLDIGKSALLTLVTNTSIMLILFISQLWNLERIIQILWLPIYLFASIFIFSLSNLYFSKKA